MVIRTSALWTLACLALAACSQENAPQESDDRIDIVGRVQHLDLEGGVYVIRTGDGAQYRPIELPEEFRVDGLAIEASAKRRDDVMTVDMAGQAVELLDIRKRVAD